MKKSLTVLTLVGARPQIIKAATLSRAFRQSGIREIFAHSGQHYDHGMSGIFFDELELPPIDFNMNVGSGLHGQQTGRILERFEQILLDQKPDVVLVHGDTNSTLAGAIAAVKLQIPIAHNESGLRSFNRSMPEEHNRILTDHCADLLFCPTATAVSQLASEGITRGVHLVGDVMYDLHLHILAKAESSSKILSEHNLTAGKYILSTLHRPYNVDDPQRLRSIFQSLSDTGEIIVLPIHPRTQAKMDECGIAPAANIKLIAPVGILDMIVLEKNARMILTDSGGIQKEAYFAGVPCVTMRPETEWVETVETGWNCVVGADPAAIADAVSTHWWSDVQPPLFGDGKAGEKIAKILLKTYS